MWLHLCNVYQQSTVAREFKVERNIAEYTQVDKNVCSFYIGLQLLWSEHDQNSRWMAQGNVVRMIKEKDSIVLDETPSWIRVNSWKFVKQRSHNCSWCCVGSRLNVGQLWSWCHYPMLHYFHKNQLLVLHHEILREVSSAMNATTLVT